MSGSSEIRAGRPLLAASILSADFAALGEEVRRAEEGGADWLHLDVMDGHFVPNLSFGPRMAAALRGRVGIYCEAHLMVSQPERFVPEYAAVRMDGITVHAEATAHLHRLLDRIRGSGARAGVALNPGTPLSAVEWALDRVDLLLIMTVNPGFGGQAFIAAMLPKIRQARAMLDGAGSRALLEVDGGIDEETVGCAVEAGADVVVAGSVLYGHAQGVGAGVAALHEAMARPPA